ncbi:KilA-N domain-containing protein [Aquipseudomonas alcaligenes]
MNSIIPFVYQGQRVRFSLDGWINATDVAKSFGKKPVEWLRLPANIRYMSALAKALGLESKVGLSHFGLVATERGGKSAGTWLHPKLAVAFARWLDDEFAVWCDLHIDSLLRGELNEKVQYERACREYEAARQLASKGASEMAKFRWRKPALEYQVEHWRHQFQLTLGLDMPSLH